MEKFSKNKKGRPKKIDDALDKSRQDLFPELTTARSRNNLHYSLLAFRLFKSTSKYGHFFIDKEKQLIHKKTVLAELGRVIDGYGEDDALALADTIYEHKMSTQMALSYIRKARGFGKNRVDGVVKKIISVINSSFLSKEEVQAVLDQLDSLYVVGGDADVTRRN